MSYIKAEMHQKNCSAVTNLISGNKSMRVYSDEALSSKVFIQFIVLILRSRIYIALKEKSEKILKKPNYLTVPVALKELEKIVMIRQLDSICAFTWIILSLQPGKPYWMPLV